MAGSKVLDVVHKAVVTGLLGATAFGLYDITRGFNVMYTRNVVRQKEWEAQQALAQAQNQPAAN
ncbi:hypothetical protein SDRG_06568 [Saprolegnia diclina VS20]|uniref:Uncharacterized protein n=1 Tax=Saprolegnia diclina (strain VS20) TaxID=1156394 RepID=T0QPN5_SAPDV|nr:hypothetical protein SDRG_06568 [Saprolegnia diclina VS20]EQC35810.1 hypothetical protein SDRG_06568 [Saprolegnia diclina VS20]|eukprot:XP_008610572.1 hypothetical protein SDRG_06568 [Saprolegnia diclina VS20]